MQLLIIWCLLALCFKGKAEAARDTSFAYPIWSPQPDVCKPGPEGRVPWILHVRDSDYGWREHTHRAMIALAVNDHPINDEMKKMQLQLEVELTRALFRNKSHPMEDSDLALYIHALLATNKNPRNFHGTDLVADLLHRVESAPGQVNPFLVLALCNSHVVAYKHLAKITQIATYNHTQTGNLLDGHPDVDSRVVQKKSLAFKAFACAAIFKPDLHKFSSEMQTIVECLHRKYNEEDGSFGNVYTTSLAVQAFTAAGNAPRWWHRSKSLAYLEEESVKEVNLIKAYYIEMALNARKYKFIRELYNGVPLPAGPEVQPDTHYVQYTIKKSPKPNMYFSVTLNVPKETNFYEVMKTAANASAAFNFTAYQSNRGEPMVYSVSGVPNDIEQNIFWRLCRQNNVDRKFHSSQIIAYHESPAKLIPEDNEHLIYIYSNTECPKK